jgi:hypothetical protein
MRRIAFIWAILLVGVVVLNAQTDPQPAKYKDVTWHSITLVDFKSGETQHAKEIIEKFESAGKSAGTPTPKTYWFTTGKYDMMVIWKLEGGPADLEWNWSPDGVEWWKAFVAQEGSEEAANKLQSEYGSLIANSTTNIARKSR